MLQTICLRRPDSHKRWFFKFFMCRSLLLQRNLWCVLSTKTCICIFSERLILQNRDWMSVMLRCNAWLVSARTWKECSGNVNFWENSVIRGGLRVLIATKHAHFCSQSVVFGRILVFFSPFFLFSLRFWSTVKNIVTPPSAGCRGCRCCRWWRRWRSRTRRGSSSTRFPSGRRSAAPRLSPRPTTGWQTERERWRDHWNALSGEHCCTNQRRGRSFQSQASCFHWFPLVMLSYDTDIVCQTKLLLTSSTLVSLKHTLALLNLLFSLKSQRQLRSIWQRSNVSFKKHS